MGAQEAAQRLSDTLSNLAPGDVRLIQIAQSVSGLRQIDKFLPILREFPRITELLEVADDAVGSVSKDAEQGLENLFVKITQVQGRFQVLFREITETETFGLIADTALKLANSLANVLDILKPLIPVFATIGAVKLGSGLLNFGRGFTNAFGGGRDPNANLQKAATTELRKLNNNLRTLNTRSFTRGAFGRRGFAGGGEVVPASVTPGERIVFS